MAAICHTIVYEQLHDNIFARQLTIGNILTLLATSLAISFESLVKLRAISPIMTYESSRPRVIYMILGRLSYLSTPQKRLDRLGRLNELDSLLHTGRSFLGHIAAIRSRHIHLLASEATEAIIQAFQEALGIRSQPILCLEDGEV